MSKLVTYLSFDHGQAHRAAEFYAATFPDSHVDPTHAALTDHPIREAGNQMMVAFTALGQAFVGLNGGPNHKPSDAVSTV